MKKRFFAVLATLTLGVIAAPSALADDGAVNPDAMKNYSSVQDMRAYFDQATTLVNQFDDAHGLRRTQQWVFVGPGQTIDIPACGQTSVSSTTLYEHCYGDSKTYIGADMMWELYQHNWAMPMIAMAHEDGHDNEEAHGLNLQLINGPSDVLKEEIQADCFSGVFANWAVPQVGANVLADVPGVLDGWGAVSSPNTPRRTHGTFPERAISFGTGFLSNNLASCDPMGQTPVS